MRGRTQTERWRVSLAAFVMAVGLVGGSAAAATRTPSPQGRVTAALKTLTTDLGKLGPKQASKPTRKALLKTAGRARRRSRRAPCQSLQVLSQLRAELIAIRVPKVKGRRPAAGSARGRIAADVLQAQVALLQLPAAKRCGGGVTSKVTQGTPTVLASDATHMQLRLDLPAPTFVAQHVGDKDWLQMFMPGMATTGGTPGNPGLPATTQFFGIPNGANVSITVDKTQGYDVGGVNLYPEQPQPVDAKPPPPSSLFANRPYKLN